MSGEPRFLNRLCLSVSVSRAKHTQPATPQIDTYVQINRNELPFWAHCQFKCILFYWLQYHCYLSERALLSYFEKGQSSAFQHLLNPFQQGLYDFDFHIFTLRTIEGLKHKYYEGSNIHWCSRRKHGALRAMKMSTCFLFCRNIHIFPLNTALWKQQKILTYFLDDKLSTVYLDLQIQNVFIVFPSGGNHTQY